MRYAMRRGRCGHCAVDVICMGKHRDFECNDRTGASGAYQSGSSAGLCVDLGALCHISTALVLYSYAVHNDIDNWQATQLREMYRRLSVLAVSYLPEI